MSYRNRGKVARSQIQKKTNNIWKITEIILLTLNLIKKVTLVALRNKIIPYSAIKRRANPTEAYSTLNPDTNSDSPSEKSKGVRLVSATQEISHKTTKGKKNRKFSKSKFLQEKLCNSKTLKATIKVNKIRAKLIS